MNEYIGRFQTFQNTNRSGDSSNFPILHTGIILIKKATKLMSCYPQRLKRYVEENKSESSDLDTSQ